MRKARMTISYGFTLIEILIVICILSVLLGIVVIAVNPGEQLKRTNDVTMSAVSKDFMSAVKYYYTQKQTEPWVKNTTCRDQLSKPATVSDLSSCANELTDATQLQTKYISSDQAKYVHVTECSGAIAICYDPQSKAFNTAGEAKYTRDGALQPGCPGSDNCYACIFSTNTAQECFSTLNPNGSLAIIPSPSPNQIIPIPTRNSKSTCGEPQSDGSFSCLADVVTSSDGTPLSSLSLPAGVGPAQLHTAYSLPCTPGGEVNATCQTPAFFGPKTIAIVIAFHSPTLESDLVGYSSAYNLPPCSKANGCLQVVNQNGQESPLPTTISPDWAFEEALDVQMAHAVCQTCKILVIEANSNYITDLGPAVNRAAAMGANAISTSWGSSEFSNQINYDQYFNHPGIFITAGSGDYGYGNLFPSTSSNVISVGGTTLSMYTNNTYFSESVWRGTGSGCSTYETANSFQTSLSNWNQTGCGTKRAASDVSAVADPNTGVAVLNTTSYGGRTGWWIVGGTSASSPIVSAALVMDGIAPTGVSSAAYIYQNPSKFRDITSGSNGGCGGIMCNGSVGYDGPTGLGSLNLLSSLNSTPTPIQTPTTTPTPSPIPTPTLTPVPTLVPITCATIQSVTLGQSNPILALPGDIVNNSLTITNNDPVGCSALFTISSGFPSSFTLSGVPASITVAGGETKIIYFTITVPTSATAGNYVYQFWAAKPGQSSVNPVNGSIQVQQVGPTPTPTPTPISCTQPWTSSLGSTSLSGNAGDTLNQTLYIKNNNPTGCSTATFGISHSYPTGWIINNLPPSVQLAAGQSTTISFTITISTGAQVQDYTLQYWINSGSLPLNATVHVLQTAPPPQGQFFSNMTAKMYGNYATFEYSYNAQGNVSGRLDVATDPSALNQTTNPPSTARYGFAFNSGNAWDASNLATPTSIRGFIVSSPQSWPAWQCGATIYYRMYNDGDKSIKSPVQASTVDCTTVIDVLPWGPWYSAIYYGIYDSRYDADKNGVVNWTDYWILVRQTRLR